MVVDLIRHPSGATFPKGEGQCTGFTLIKKTGYENDVVFSYPVFYEVYITLVFQLQDRHWQQPPWLQRRFSWN